MVILGSYQESALWKDDPVAGRVRVLAFGHQNDQILVQILQVASADHNKEKNKNCSDHH